MLWRSCSFVCVLQLNLYTTITYSYAVWNYKSCPTFSWYILISNPFVIQIFKRSFDFYKRMNVLFERKHYNWLFESVLLLCIFILSRYCIIWYIALVNINLFVQCQILFAMKWLQISSNVSTTFKLNLSLC